MFYGIGDLFQGKFVAEPGKGALGTKLTSIGLVLKSALHGYAGA